MQPPTHPATIQKIGSELAIAWSDGLETYIPLEALRAACPCAVCCGEPDLTGKVVVTAASSAPGRFELMTWQTVGGYGLQFKWGDGHGTGIYSHALLRRLGQS